MYIESPDFPHRKVFNVNNSRAGIGGFGMERVQLANYVHAKLEDHRDDAAVLERFRREAEEYKRNLLRGKHGHREKQPSSLMRMPISASIPTQSYRSPPTVQEKIRTEQSVEVEQVRPQRSRGVRFKEQTSESSKIIIIREPEPRSYLEQQQIYAQLHRRDQKLMRQAELLKRNEEKMKDLAMRVEYLENERKERIMNRLNQVEEDSYGRIKNLMNSMSNQILENKSYLQQSLQQINRKASHNKLDYDEQRVPKAPKATRKQTHRRHPVSNPEEKTPAIAYNYSVLTDKQMEQRKNLNSVIKNWSSNLSRLDSLNNYEGRRSSSLLPYS